MSISRASEERIVWGTDETGLVADIVYVSNDQLHVIEFTIEAGDRWVTSEAKRTRFNADEVFLVLEGTLVLANPETGEVYVVEEGQSVFFRRDTWHHGFAPSGRVRVLEFMAPPPSQGTTQAYARTHPNLVEFRYTDDRWRDCWPMAAAKQEKAATMVVLDPAQRLWRLDDVRGWVVTGGLADTDQLTVAESRVVAPGLTEPIRHDGFAASYVLEGSVRFVTSGGTIEAETGDVIEITGGTEYRLEGYGCLMTGISRSNVNV